MSSSLYGLFFNRCDLTNELHTFFLSNDPDDNVFERLTPSSPKMFDDHHRDIFSHHQKRTSRGSASGSIDHQSINEGTMDSPISQVNFDRLHKKS